MLRIEVYEKWSSLLGTEKSVAKYVYYLIRTSNGNKEFKKFILRNDFNIPSTDKAISEIMVISGGRLFGRGKSEDILKSKFLQCFGKDQYVEGWL